MTDISTKREDVERLAHHAGKLLLGTTLGEPVPNTMLALLAARDAARAEVERLRAALLPYERAVYEAVRALLRYGHFGRLEIGPGEKEGDITVGLHAGWGDGEFVVMSDDGKTEWALATCDASVARELAAALTAYADWCDEEADAFMTRIEAEKAKRTALTSEEADDE